MGSQRRYGRVGVESEGILGRSYGRYCQRKNLHSSIVIGTDARDASKVYAQPSICAPFAGTTNPPLYLTHPIPHRPLTSVRFCPFQDILTIGHSAGLSSILVPGSGEPNFDSSEADPFENKRRRREREVRGLLDKVASNRCLVVHWLIIRVRYNRI
jgi:BING4CT (NUC141) domain